MITISKTEFEHALYVATSSTMRVYEGCTPYIDYAILLTSNNILGKAITDDVLAGNAVLLDRIKRHVAYTAFLNVFRQLDLVLTPTGFGVVSDERTVPASSQRVDALESQIRVERERNYGNLLLLLCQVEGWGTQPQAAYCIKAPFFDFNELERRLGRPASLDEWSQVATHSLNTKMALISFFGRKQWDDIMAKVRCYSADNTVYNEVAERIKEIVFLHSMMSPMEHLAFTELKDFVENNLETFTIYAESQEYKANHYERYQNAKDSAAFIFAG